MLQNASQGLKQVCQLQTANSIATVKIKPSLAAVIRFIWGEPLSLDFCYLQQCNNVTELPQNLNERCQGQIVQQGLNAEASVPTRNSRRHLGRKIAPGLGVAVQFIWGKQ
jgi:hypothetical protein